MNTTWQQFSKELSDTISRVGRSIVAVDGRGGHTSGGIIWQSDYVLTAAHTIRNDVPLRVVSADRTVPARIAGRDNSTDIALLRVDQDLGGDSAKFGPTDSLAVGEIVVAVARTRRGNVVASTGILSGLMGEWQFGRTRIDQFIRPDLTLYPGFSGGALVRADGSIIGMNAGGLLRGRPITIPGSTLTRVAEVLTSRGHIPRPYLGLVMQSVPVPESLQKHAGIGFTNGLLVMHVEPQSPAEQGGVLLGDLLVELDSQALDDLEDLQVVLQQRGVGHDVKVTVIRGGQKTELSIKIAERPIR